jgi:anaerobic dimethyl sulfoxide reductase subunit C (anchor subunit)
MSTTEWPLVVFTLLVQTAAGLVVLAEIAALAGGAAARDLLKYCEACCLGLGVVGLAVSFAHLGAPLHSPYALLNIAHSWLSREIAVTSLFLAVLVVLVAARFGRPALAGPLAALAAVLGVATVFVMSRVYTIVTVPAWDSPATVVNFAGTALLLGALAAGALLSFRWATAEAAAPAGCVLRLILAFAAVGLLAKLVELPLSLAAGMAANARGTSAAAVMLSDGLELSVLRLVLLLAAAALFVHLALRAMRGRIAALPVLGVAAFAMAFAGEMIGRFAFFGMHVLIGL